MSDPRLALFSFFCGGLLFLGNTVGNALFIKHYPPETLVFIYLATGILTTLISLGALVRRYRMTIVLPVFLGVMVAVMAVFSFLHATMPEYRRQAAAMLFFATTVGYMLFGQFFVQFLSSHFDVRQMKERYGVIQAGEVLAYLAVGITVPLLFSLTAVPIAAILVPAMLCGVGAITLFFSFRSVPAPVNSAGDRRVARSGFRQHRKHSYLWMIIAFTVCQAMAYCIVDYLYNRGMKQQFASPEQLGFYFALFSATAKLSASALSLTVARSVLQRIGVGGGLAILPVVVAVVLAVAGIASFAGLPAAMLIFACFVIGKMSFSVVGIPFANPALSTLLQLFPAARHERMVAVVLGMVRPLASALGGLVLYIVFYLAGPAPSAVLTGGIALLLAIWLAMAFALYARYAQRLRSLLGTLLQPRGAVMVDDETLAHLESRMLADRNYLATVQVLALLEQYRPERLPEVVERKFSYANGEEEKHLLACIEKHRWDRYRERVRALCVQRKRPDVAVAAIQCLGAIGDTRDIETVLTGIDPGDEKIRDRALSLCLRRGILAGTTRSELDRLAAVPDGRGLSRLIAIHRHAGVLLPDAYRDRCHASTDPQILRDLIRYIGALHDAAGYPRIVEGLSDPLLCMTAYRAAGDVGEPIVPALVARYRDDDDPYLRRMVLMTMAQIGGEAAWRFVHERIMGGHPVEQRLVGAAFLGKAAPDALFSVEDADRLRDTALSRMEALWSLRAASPRGDLRLRWGDAVDEELSYEAALLLFAVSIHRPVPDLPLIRRHLFSDDRKKAAVAVELLEKELGHARFAALAPMFDRIVRRRDPESGGDTAYRERWAQALKGGAAVSSYFMAMTEQLAGGPGDARD